MQRGVEAWGKDAGGGLVRVVVDHVGMGLDDGDVDPVEERECAPDHIGLEGGVAGLSEWAAERELAVEEPWRLDVVGLAADQGDPDGGHAGCFEDSREHTHGARAKRSDRSEENDVDSVFSKHPGGGRSGVEEDRGEGGVALRPHERDVVAGH